VGFPDIDHVELGEVAVLPVDLFKAADLAPEWRSGEAAEDQDGRLWLRATDGRGLAGIQSRDRVGWHWIAGLKAIGVQVADGLKEDRRFGRDIGWEFQLFSLA
jgi:hypothetical protein